MKDCFERGFGFGSTSGIITTLGVMVGLYSGTHSKLVLLGGILSVAIADAFSDALGMHISEEAGDKRASSKKIWSCTFFTFIFKFLFAILFIAPLLLFEINLAVIVSIILGIVLLGLFSYNIAKKRKEKPLNTVLEHLGIAILVIIITYFVGEFVSVFS